MCWRIIPIVLLLFGCISFPPRRPPVPAVRPLPIIWTFGCSFPDDSRSAARDGMEYWNLKLGRVFFKEADDCSMEEAETAIIIFIAPIEDPHPDPGSETLAQVIGWAGKFGRWGDAIVLFKAWTHPDNINFRTSTVRHEAGHVLGLDHSTVDHGCLMDKVLRPGLIEACQDEIRWVKEKYKEKRGK